MLRMALFGIGGQMPPRPFFARFPFQTRKPQVRIFFWDQFFGAKSAIHLLCEASRAIGLPAWEANGRPALLANREAGEQRHRWCIARHAEVAARVYLDVTRDVIEQPRVQVGIPNAEVPVRRGLARLTED